MVTLDPNGFAPLTAVVELSAVAPVSVDIEVLGADPLAHAFLHVDSVQSFPVLGLYAGTDNRVVVTVTEPGVRIASDTLVVTTLPLPESFPAITVQSAQHSSMEDGLTIASFSAADGGTFASWPFAFDANGDIRWYLDLSRFDDTVFGVEPLANGNLVTAYGRSIYELDLLGRTVREWTIPGYWYHHDVIELPNRNLLVAVAKDGPPTIDDHIIEIDRATGVVVNEWDLRQVLDVDRRDFLGNATDWLHMNAIWYDERDDTIIVSGRNQGIAKVTRNNELVWILAPHRGWGAAGPEGDGFDTADFLLIAVDAQGVPYTDDIQQGTSAAADFDWVWGQHAPMLLPNGNLLVFDNGVNRNFGSAPLFSRGVEYTIDEDAMTVRQVWSYGEQRGADYYSSIISDVDYLPRTGNRLIAPGFIDDGAGPPTAYVTEVDPDRGDVIFDARIDMKNLASTGSGWGQFDIVYRAERMRLYPRYSWSSGRGVR